MNEVDIKKESVYVVEYSCQAECASEEPISENIYEKKSERLSQKMHADVCIIQESRLC